MEKEKYIQLPPIPEELDVNVVRMIWEYSKRQIFQRISYSPVFLYNRSRKIFRLFHYNYGG